MKPLYIFDLDGTLALIEHRYYLLDDINDPERWKNFFAACDKDEPYSAVIQVLETLRKEADVLIFTGRSDEVRDKTVSWLVKHTSFTKAELDKILTMRPAGDYSPNKMLKKEWLNALSVDDRHRLVAIFDDEDSVVAMWRENGIPCFQVKVDDFKIKIIEG